MDLAPQPSINQTVLMTGADHFGIVPLLNPYELPNTKVDLRRAKADFNVLLSAFKQAGIAVIKQKPPRGCQDGVYTANWGICRGDTAVLSSLPPHRTQEEPYADSALRNLGKKIIKSPYPFSGQGDALPCGDLLFAGSGYRTDKRMHPLLARELGYEVVSLETMPEIDKNNHTVINKFTGWPDSYFYDLDLALGVLRADLIAWCPDAFTKESAAKIRSLKQLDKIEVSLDEAVHGFACNLVSTGSTVIMSAKAPKLKSAIEKHGLRTIPVNLSELAKGGGGIRCCALTLDNQ